MKDRERNNVIKDVWKVSFLGNYKHLPLFRKDEIVHQLDEALQTARETKETLRELYIR